MKASRPPLLRPAALFALMACLAAICPSSPAEERSARVIRNPVTWFEIPVTDLDRAVAFYRGVFGFELERVAIDGNEMALFPAADGQAGISGALAKGDSYLPSTSGTRVYFTTENIDETLRKVGALGGRTLYPKTSIGALGWVAEFEDSEGNRVALHSNEE